jgi:hypothetical protein
MTEREYKELWREDIQPVILGNGPQAHAIALRLRLLYGLSSLLCAPKRSIGDLLDPASTYFPLVEADSRLLCEQLIAISERYDGYRLLLIPSTDAYRAWILENADPLEEDFLLTDPDELEKRLPAFLRSL